jgi:acetyltransferase-like isoleucine patch superfamily enzyme
MMKLIKEKYQSLCRRIYSVGKEEYERIRVKQNMEHIEYTPPTYIGPAASMINLSNDKQNIKVGSNCYIYGSLTVMNYGGKISIGQHCTLGDLSRIVSSTSITIGNRVLISHNVNILDNNSHPLDANLRHLDFLANFEGSAKQFNITGKAIVIEDDVWIGFNSIILKGVTIGRGAIIGAGSVVTRDVQPWTVNVGNPLRCVQQIEANKTF